MFKQYPKLQIRSILVDCVFCLFVCLYKARRQCFNLSLFPQEPLTVLSINIYHIDGFIISYLLSGINYISSLQHHGCYSLMLTFLSNIPVGGYSINQKKNKLSKSKKKKKIQFESYLQNISLNLRTRLYVPSVWIRTRVQRAHLYLSKIKFKFID